MVAISFAVLHIHLRILLCPVPIHTFCLIQKLIAVVFRTNSFEYVIVILDYLLFNIKVAVAECLLKPNDNGNLTLYWDLPYYTLKNVHFYAFLECTWMYCYLVCTQKIALAVFSISRFWYSNSQIKKVQRKTWSSNSLIVADFSFSLINFPSQNMNYMNSARMLCT